MVVAFSRLMEQELAVNDDKGGWEDCGVFWLIRRLREETDELEAAVRKGGPAHATWHALVASEAADVANFALMVADVCGAVPTSEKS